MSRFARGVLATAVFLVLIFSSFAFSATDNFDTSGPLNNYANWVAHTALQVTGGAVFNTDPQNGWDYYAVYQGQVNPNDISMVWDGSTASNGVIFTGLVVFNAFSTTADGYLIQYRNDSGVAKLFEIQNGVLKKETTIDEKPWGADALGPGSTLQVKYNAATHIFNVYGDGQLGATLSDGAARVNLATSYGGFALYGKGAPGSEWPVHGITSFTATQSAQSGDSTPPDAVVDLNATAQSASSIALSWTATGDDGQTGTATTYDIRYSTSNINNDTDFASATLVTGEPSPKPSGSSESMVVSGLSASTTYYFAMKVSDEAGNWSSLSNKTFATTSAGGGGGGGGTTPLSCDPVDDFERADLGSSWATNNQFIEVGELAVTPNNGVGWDNYALYTKAGPRQVSVDFSANNILPEGQNEMYAGLVIFADSADPATFNGVVLLRRAEGVSTYLVASGVLQRNSGVVRGGAPDSPPKPGDNLKVVLSVPDPDDGVTKNISVYVNDVLDVSFSMQNSASLDDLYAGVIQYSGADNSNNLDNFQACYPGSEAAPENIAIISGDGQSGAVQTQLPDPIKVQVTNASGQGVEGVLLDFQVTQGSATLVDIENFAFDGKLWREAEDGRILVPIGSVATDDLNASGEQYVMTSYTSGYRGQTALEIPVYVPLEDTYDIWLRYKTDSSSRDGVYVSLDDDDIGNRIDVPNYSNTWAWIKCRTLPITKGSHKVKLTIYEPGWGWDKILLQKAGSAAPSGVGGDYPAFPNVTDAEGFAQTHVAFGTDANTDVIIQVSGEKNDGTPLNNSPVSFTLDPLPGPAARIGDPYQENKAAGEVLNLKVNVWDAYGNNVAGHTVNWSITSGETLGSFNGSATTSSNTNQLGEAVATLTIDPTAPQGSTITVQAASAGLTGSPVTIVVNIGEGAEFIQRIQPAGPVQDRAGQVLPAEKLPVVKVTKADGTAFPNYPVNFVVTQGNGFIGVLGDPDSTNVTVVTDNNGLATVNWKIGLGANQLEVRTPALDPQIITFNATGVTGEPANLAKVSGDAQNGFLGIPLDNPYVVKVTDSNGFAVSGEPVSFTITAGTNAYFGTPGNIDTTLNTDANGQAQVVITLGSVLNEQHQVTAAVVNYTGIPAVTFTATPTGSIANEIQYESGNGQFVTNPDGGGYWLYQSKPVTSQLDEPFKVKVLDPFDNPVAGQDVTFSVIQGGGNFANKSSITVQSDAQGIAQATLTLGTLAGDSVHVVQATAVRANGGGTALVGSPVTFKATGLPLDAEKLVKDATTDNQQQRVGSALPKPIRVKVEDIYGNSIAGHLVTFSLQPGNGTIVGQSGEVSTAQVTTSDSGFASAVWKMPASPPGQVFMQVSGLKPDSDPLVNSPMSFSAFATPEVADSMLVVNADTLFEATVGTSIPEQIAVKIVDRFNNPVSKIPVNFNIADGDGKVNGLPNVTVLSGDDGLAGVIWTLGTKSGILNNILEVTASVPNNPLLRFKASGRASVPDSLKPDRTYDLFGAAGSMLETGPVKVMITDRYGNPVPDHQVIFTVVSVDGNQGYIDIPGQITKEVQSDADGIARANWYLGPAPGVNNNKLRASSKYNNIELKGSPFEFVVSTTANVAAKLLAVTDTTNLEATTTNNLPDGLKVKVTDDFGNPIPNYQVKFEVLTRQTAGGGSLDGDIDSVKVKATNSNGIASVEFKLGSVAGIKNNQVRVTALKDDETHLIGSPLIFYISGKSTDAVAIAKELGDNQSGVVGEYLSQMLQVSARDQFGNKVPGQPITFRIKAIPGLPDSLLGSLGDGGGPELTVVTAGDGVARAQWKLSRRVGTYTVEATSFSGGQPLTNSPVTFTANAVAGATDAKASTILASPLQTTVSTGANKVQISVTLLDKYGNPVKDRAVILLDKKDMGFRINQPTQLSNSAGLVTGSISSEKAGDVWVFARDLTSGVDIVDSAKVTFLPANAAKVDKAETDSGDQQRGNRGTVLPNKLKVVVTDQYGNRIPDYAVIFRVTEGNGEILEPQPVATDSNGVAASTLRLGPEAGLNIVRVEAPGLTGSGLQFTAIGEVPTNIDRLVIISGDSLTAAPGATLPEPLVVQLLDSDGNPVWGEIVVFERKLNNGNIITDKEVMTNSLGMAQATASVGTDAGVANIYTATVKRLPSIYQTFYAWTQSQTASRLEYDSGSNQENVVGQPLFRPFSVKTVDEFGNGVANVPVKFEVVNDASVAGVGTLEGGAMVKVVNSNNSGIASVYYTLGTKAGLNKVRASSTNLLPNFITFQAIGLPSYAYSMEKFDGDNQMGEMGKELFNPIRVIVRDQFGNPTAGGAVRFVVIEGGGEITSGQTAISDSNGLAAATWRLGPPSSGTTRNRAVASSNLPGGSFTVEFTATGDPNRYPIINLADEYVINEGDAFSLPVTAYDPDGDPVTLDQPVGLPDSASWTAVTPDGVMGVSWNVSYHTIKLPTKQMVWTPTFTARDNKTGRTRKTVRFVVKNVNRAPVLSNPVPIKSFFADSAGSNITFSIHAEDLDFDPLSFSWTVDGTSEGADDSTFSWTLPETPVSETTTIAVLVSDGEATVTYEWTVRVLVTSVELSTFTSSVKPYQGVTLEWATATERNNAGFNILRSLKEDGDYEKINSRLIEPRKDRQYRFIDPDVEAGTKYYYKLEDVNLSGRTGSHGPVIAEVGVPEKFELSQNYPNPFNPTTSIRFSLPRAARVKLEIYNIMGQRVKTLVDDSRKAGYHVVQWNGLNEAGSRVGSGIYYYRILAEDYVRTKKMILLK